MIFDQGPETIYVPTLSRRWAKGQRERQAIEKDARQQAKEALGGWLVDDMRKRQALHSYMLREKWTWIFGPQRERSGNDVLVWEAWLVIEPTPVVVRWEP